MTNGESGTIRNFNGIYGDQKVFKMVKLRELQWAGQVQRKIMASYRLGSRWEDSVDADSACYCRYKMMGNIIEPRGLEVMDLWMETGCKATKEEMWSESAPLIIIQLRNVQSSCPWIPLSVCRFCRGSLCQKFLPKLTGMLSFVYSVNIRNCNVKYLCYLQGTLYAVNTVPIVKINFLSIFLQDPAQFESDVNFSEELYFSK